MNEETRPDPSTAAAPPRKAERDGQAQEVLAGGGRMGERMRGVAWGDTLLGPLEAWPQSLRSALSICLGSRFPIAIYWGPELALLYNDAWAPIPGGKHPWALGRAAREVWPEIWSTIGPLFEQVMGTGEATYSEDSLLPMHRHGYTEECYFNFTFTPIRGEGGRVEGVFNAVIETTFRVVSDRRTGVLRELGDRTAGARSAEEACALAATSLGTSTHDVPFSVLYLVDEDGKQARLAGVSGLPAGSPAAPEVVSLGAEDDSTWPLAKVRRTGQLELQTGLPERFGVELPRGPWPEPTTAALVAPIVSGASASPAGYLVVGLSPRLAPDDEYRQFVERAAAHVARVLTSAGAYQAERKKSEALAELDRAKTVFFSNVSHELRTPLTLMLGPIEDGLGDRKQPLPPAQRERLELARRNGLRLQKLVNTLLDFARIEAGRAQASFVPTDLPAFTIDLAGSFESALAAAGLELQVDCPPLPEPVLVDPAMWEKIVFNLISNAFKFTFKGKVIVALKARGASVELSVRDTGTGIAADELPRIFERFHRVEGARGRSHEGTGIGLALVQELVKLHGGTLSVSSKPGEGSTFTVSLPTGSAQPARPAAAAPARMLRPTGIGAGSFLAEMSQWNPPEGLEERAPAPPPAVDSERPRSEERILIADDNADMRRYLLRLLSPHWVTEAVSDGDQALAVARTRPPDLILSDVMMPGLDGLSLVRALREGEQTRTIPVMLLSARAGEDATIEGLQSGADGYLVKPFSANELHARVSALLAVSRLRLQAASAERVHAEEARRLLAESRRATEAREETLAVVSHDLRAPLNIINTVTGIIERALAKEPSLEGLKKQTDAIKKSVTRMDRLIRDLLDLASIDSGTLSLEPEQHPPDKLLRELREMFTPQAIAKGLSLEVEAEPGLPVLEADGERVIQVLTNLLSNALKFTPEGGKLSLRAQRHPDGLLFSVSDTGAGIAADEVPFVFDRYWHANKANRESHGLGLAISKGLVEAHGGTLRVESQPGRGSTFSFVLPLAPPARSNAPAPPPPRPAPLQAPAPVQPPAPPAAARPAPTRDFLAGGGEMGKLIRAMDWSQTPLGPVDSWPQSLRTTVSLCVSSNFPMSMAWGPSRIQIYNDGYRAICGGKHPGSMGQDFKECWASPWPQIGAAFELAQKGETRYLENVRMFLDRNGYLEETFFTFSFSPVRDETGGIGGLFHPVTETTGTMLSERRTRVLRDLAARTGKAKTTAEAFALATRTLAGDDLDLPFLLFYSLEADGKTATLVGRTGIAEGAPQAPARIDLEARDSVWPVAEVARTNRTVRLDDVAARLAGAPCGPYPELPKSALVLPMTPPGSEQPAAVIVAGVSSRLTLNDVYLGYYDLLAGTLTAAMANALAYEQERQRAEALAELDRAKTTFFSNVSHEFRTPLTLILGPVEDALAQPGRSLAGEKLELVRRNALRLHKMVNTLLDFSRMEAGRAQASFVPTELGAFTRNLASAFESAATSAGLQLHVHCPPLPQAIYVDPEMWEKIVLNLLSNAVKYTYRGQIHVALDCVQSQAVLTVRDTGVGIPREELPRVFERFYRVRATQGRSHEGTGIGLALVHELVALHGGTVSVESVFGEGTTFTVRLPAGQAHLPQDRVDRSARPRTSAAGVAPFLEEAKRWSATDAPAAPALPPSVDGKAIAGAPAALSEARILLADDNADLRSYVGGLLGREFRNVEQVPDGEAALAAARARRPDLILSDVMMPRLDGFGLVRELRAHAETRAIPVILLSARAGEESTVEGLESGADDYLAKPFSARELLARVRTQLEMSRIRRQVSAHETRAADLEQALRARDEFLSVASHELRTPVSALALQMEGLSPRRIGELTPDQLRARSETIAARIARLVAMVAELDEVSELLTGRLALHLEETDLRLIAAAVVGELKDKAAAGATPVALTGSSKATGRCDGERIRKVLVKLLGNALKFGAGKPVEVRLAGDEAGTTISIVDHGPGVPAADRERIFQRFERAVSARNYGGFGLGLWIARQVLGAHGGTIDLGETPGGGATFTLWLPITPPAFTNPASSA